ncbi:MAG: CBS domain-containing protein [Deltaproteobacteria bacterium]|nr:CBS domain-containing protein [Deltaproteobacteria bacterium]
MNKADAKPQTLPRGTGGSGFSPSGSVLGIMQTPVWTLQASDPLTKAINLLGSEKARQSPVLKGDELIGVLCSCHLSELLAASLRELANGKGLGELNRVRIEEVVAGGAVSIGPYHSIVAAAQVLLERRSCALPVVDQRRVVGLVTQGDLLRALIDRVKELEARL